MNAPEVLDRTWAVAQHAILCHRRPMRTALNISLPEATRTWVEDQVKKHGYGTVSEYIRQLLREEQKRQMREEVDRNLLDALDSGEATSLTPRDWQDIEREGLRRVRRRKKTRATR